MAEAHQAVAFQFVVTEEGSFAFRYDRDALRSIFSGTSRQLRKKYAILRNRLLREVFPASPVSLFVIFCLFVLGSLFGYDLSFGLFSLWDWILFLRIVPSFLRQTFVLMLAMLSLWYLTSYLMRKTLKLLLSYQGWMLERNRKQTLRTKLWGLAVKILSSRLLFSRPMLYSYQMSLPHLPLPPLSDTLKRYLCSVEPLLSESEHQEMQQLAKEFENGPGKKLQFYLYLKTWWSNNYVTDWWEQYVYLYGRNSIMINSNYYATDGQAFELSTNPAARGGVTLHSMMRMKKMIETEKLKPLIIRDLIPLCSAQYERLFGTVRIPGKSVDSIQHSPGVASNHVVVYKKGAYYKLPLTFRGRLLTPAEIQKQLQLIIDDDCVECGPGEEHLPAMTSENRKTWALFYDKYMQNEANREAIDAINKAAIMVFLDDSEPSLTVVNGDSSNLSAYCRMQLHGNGYNKWFDKSTTLTLYKNARIGVNAEHAWADAPIVGHLMEFVSASEYAEGTYVNGNASGTVQEGIPPPEKLTWSFPSEAVDVIDRAVSNAQESIDDLDLYVMEHTNFGKGAIKQFKMSPDAFLQMALQLAYYRDAGKFCLTYEASMTRLFVGGRTETVRSCTTEAANFVKAMEDSTVSNKERLRLLRVATDRHQALYMHAMMGKGVDRHLFCLYVMSRYHEMESQFLDKVLGEPWRLSTSQTPTQQTGRIDFNRDAFRVTSGGGFGPVAKDGYGVSYIIPGDYLFYFHVSSFKSSSMTDSRKFASRIAQSLADIKALCESEIEVDTNKPQL
jgi:hypothetical protein